MLFRSLQTGKLYNLKVNSYVDERRDPVKSTQAACDYFKNMYAIYHDWLLVIASYNCGAGNVNKAIARSGGKTNFWEISRYLPRETRGYVPAFIAVTYLMNYSAEHNLTAVPPVISFYEADTVLVDQQVSLRDVAELIDVPLDLLSYLNPLYKRGIIPESDEPQVLRLPTNKMNTYLARVDKLFTPDAQPDFPAGNDDSPLADYITKQIKKYHTVRKGEHLYSIADKYNCSINDIKRWNKFKGNKIYKGQRLLVYVSVKERAQLSSAGTKKVSGAAVANAADKPGEDTSLTAKPEGNDAKPSGSNAKIQDRSGEKYTWHIVQKGDTLYSIARRYEGTVDEIKSLNNLNTNDLKPGTKLRVKVGV